MIEDKELRNLFKIESEERLQHLDDGLLRLEKTPTDQPLLEELFREAHSLKGAARMLGLTGIQTLAHQLEDALAGAKKGEAALNPDSVAGMNKTLMAIRGLVAEAIGEQSGAESGVRSAEAGTEPVPMESSILPSAMGTAKAVAESGAPKAELTGVASGVQIAEAAIEAAAPAATAPQTAVQPAPPLARPDAFRIESIRVDPKKLDALLTQAGELTVTKIRIERRLAEIDTILDYCDEWGRSLQTARLSPDSEEQVQLHLAPLLEMLSHMRGGAYEDGARLDFISDKLESGIRALRLLPMSTLFGLFPRLVHDLAQEQGKQVELSVEGEETVADKRVLEEMKDPLMHILRNAIGHGIETPDQREKAGKPATGKIVVRATQTPASIVIEIRDDGRGLDVEAIRRTALKQGLYREEELAAMGESQIQSLILVSGLSTSSFVTDVSGRGVGLDVVRNNVERLKGNLEIESAPGKGLTLRVRLPVSLATVRVLIAAANGRRYALPVEDVEYSRKVQRTEIYTVEGRQTLSFEGRPVSVASLDDLLGIQSAESSDLRHSLPDTRHFAGVCIVLAAGDDRFGLLVDELYDELEVVLKPQSKLLKRVRNVAGATILETGEVCMVLNPHDLLKTLRKRPPSAATVMVAATAPKKKVVLLAEDSITTRTQEKRILENAGYEVVAAVDGADAYNKLGTRAFDAVVSDILMPNMTGLALTEKIRAEKKYAELPIILVTSLASDEDKRRGLEAGANAYISKPSFDQRVLLDCLARLI